MFCVKKKKKELTTQIFLESMCELGSAGVAYLLCMKVQGCAVIYES